MAGFTRAVIEQFFGLPAGSLVDAPCGPYRYEGLRPLVVSEVHCLDRLFPDPAPTSTRRAKPPA